MMNIPIGATHYSDVYGNIHFWKREVERYCFEFEPEGEPFYSWYIWADSLDTWLPENCACSRHFKLVEELNEYI